MVHAWLMETLGLGFTAMVYVVAMFAVFTPVALAVVIAASKGVHNG